MELMRENKQLASAKAASLLKKSHYVKSKEKNGLKSLRKTSHDKTKRSRIKDLRTDERSPSCQESI